MNSFNGRLQTASTADRDPFVEYYAKESISETTLQRFEAVRSAVLREMTRQGRTPGSLDVADIGCGAGTQCLIWARQGHRVHGLDINRELMELGRHRAREAGFDIEFRDGSATDLPFASESMDVCLVPELLEHVADWESCLDEFARVLRPGGLLYLSTTNRLCPKQAEFNLPLYSWYPRPLQRRYERLAVTTRPELANFAKYPAVHWFTFYSLRDALTARGFEPGRDRFDLVDLSSRGALARITVNTLRALPPLRWLGHVLTPYSVVLACKQRAPKAA
jgi:2-polyprenyl-6-hydroxyphenyl methylase/3-demethylubiquinone-9 3-methyltransferase